MSHWENKQKNGKEKHGEWYTPKYIFDALNCNFDLDVAAPAPGPLHVPCSKWLSERSLETDWHGFVWMNPPYLERNGLVAWLRKFFDHGNGVALVPDRTSAPWWQDAAAEAESILFVAGKIKFIEHGKSVGKSPSNGTCLLGIGRTAQRVMSQASENGLGLLIQKDRWMRVAA